MVNKLNYFKDMPDEKPAVLMQMQEKLMKALAWSTPITSKAYASLLKRFQKAILLVYWQKKKKLK